MQLHPLWAFTLWAEVHNYFVFPPLGEWGCPNIAGTPYFQLVDDHNTWEISLIDTLPVVEVHVILIFLNSKLQLLLL